MKRSYALLQRMPPRIQGPDHALLKAPSELRQHGESLFDPPNRASEQETLAQTVHRAYGFAHPAGRCPKETHFQIIASLHGTLHKSSRVKERTAFVFHASPTVPQVPPNRVGRLLPIAG